MWSCRRAARLSRTLATVLLLAGCGFRPMYAPAGNQTVLEDFSGVQVAVIEDRIGQQLRNDLQDLLTPRGRPAAPDFVLRVELSERLRTLALERTGLATRADLTIVARFSLDAVETGETVLSQTTSASSSYNILQSDYATLIAARDAQTKAVRVIAEDIRNRLGVYFTGARSAEARSAGARSAGSAKWS